MLRLLIFSLIFCFVSLPLFAQSDPAAKVILDNITAKIKNFKAIQASFNYKTEDAKGKLKASQNGILFIKESKYRITITGQEIFCDGKTIWTYDKSANEVTITNADPPSNVFTVQKLFTNFYDKDFLYKLNGEKKLGAKTIQEIEMTPTDKSKVYFKVYIYVDKIAKVVYSASVLEKNGSKNTYTINSLNGNAVISDNQFVFDKSKFPSVEEKNLTYRRGSLKIN